MMWSLRVQQQDFRDQITPENFLGCFSSLTIPHLIVNPFTEHPADVVTP